MQDAPRFSCTHVRSHFADDRLRHHHIHAIDARQVHPGDALQFVRKMEVRIILVLFLLFLSGVVLPLLAARRYRHKCRGVSVISGRIPRLIAGRCHTFPFPGAAQDQFLVPVALQAFSNLCTAGLNPRVTEFLPGLSEPSKRRGDFDY